MNEHKFLYLCKKLISENNYHCGKPAINRKKVVQMDLDGNIIKIWYFIHQAVDETNSSATKIVACCKGKRKMHNKYKWKYYED